MAQGSEASFGKGSDLAPTLTLGYFISILVSSLTLLTFGLALLAVPIAGKYCPENCITYPFLDIVDQFPKDYLWMYPATVLALVFVALVAAIHQAAAADKKIFTLIGLCFAVMSSTILAIAYFVQVSVIQPNLELGQTEGIALLTMYNEHGVFIALEDIGYLLMAAALGCMAPAFDGRSLGERIVKWTFAAAPVLTILALVFYSFRYGIYRGYTFEVAAISINWLALIIGDAALIGVFKRARGQLVL